MLIKGFYLSTWGYETTLWPSSLPRDLLYRLPLTSCIQLPPPSRQELQTPYMFQVRSWSPTQPLLELLRADSKKPPRRRLVSPHPRPYSLMCARTALARQFMTKLMYYETMITKLQKYLFVGKDLKQWLTRTIRSGSRKKWQTVSRRRIRGILKRFLLIMPHRSSSGGEVYKNWNSKRRN